MSHMIRQALLNTGYVAVGGTLLWHQLQASHHATVHAQVTQEVTQEVIQEVTQEVTQPPGDDLQGQGSSAQGIKDDLRLRQVQVIFRHGARTPIHTLPRCRQISYPADILMRPHPATVFPYHRRCVTTGGALDWSPYQHHLMKSAPLKGGSYPGMLTSLGQDQCLMLGRRLRRAYGGVLGTDAGDPGLTYCISTNIQRTVESARCVMAGYFNAEQLRKLSTPPTIYVCPEDHNFLIPDTHSCPDLRRVNHVAMKEADSITEFPFLEDRKTVEAVIDEKRLKAIDEISQLDEQIQKKGEKQKEILADRDKVASDVPQFWSDVLCRHPSMSQIITSQDLRCLTFLTGVEVTEIPSTGGCLKKSGYRYTFHFEDNPFFRNKTITKEVYKFHKDKTVLPHAITCYRSNKHIVKGNSSKTTEIDWKEGIDVSWIEKKSSKKNKKNKQPSSFFAWLAQNTKHNDSVAEMLREDVYMRPSHYILQEPERPEFSHRDVNFVYARDDIVARQTHGWWAPPGLEPLSGTIAAHATALLHMGMTGITREERPAVTRMSVGRLMQSFHDTATQLMTGTKENQKRLVMYSAHDSTLAAVMEALGIWDNVWPVYGADIVMELWQKPDSSDFYVQFLYNGKPVMLRGQVTSLIPWNTYTRVMSEYQLTDAAFLKLCQPESSQTSMKKAVPDAKEEEKVTKNERKEDEEEDDEDEDVPTGM